VIEKCHKEDQRLASIMQRQRGKGIGSLFLYSAAVPLAYVNAIISGALFVLVAVLWLIPDKRIEQLMAE
jgi:hypothetical protein